MTKNRTLFSAYEVKSHQQAVWCRVYGAHIEEAQVGQKLVRAAIRRLQPGWMATLASCQSYVSQVL